MLPMFVVYDSPTDYPGRYVLRRLVVQDDGKIVHDAKPLAVALRSHPAALAAVRLPIPAGLVRAGDPDPRILEVWF